MRPATNHADLLRQLVVTLVSIRMKPTGKVLEEILCVFCEEISAEAA